MTDDTRTTTTPAQAAVLGADLGADCIELLQLISTGSVEVRRVTSDQGIMTSFSMLDLIGSQRHARPVAPEYFSPRDTHKLTRYVLSAARHGLVELEWDDPAKPWFSALCTGMPVLTDTAQQALLGYHRPRFAAQGAGGAGGWKRNPVTEVPRAYVVPGNIVHSSHGLRFQVARLHRAGEVTHLFADGDSGHSEAYESKLTIPVETASLLPGQRVR